MQSENSELLKFAGWESLAAEMDAWHAEGKQVVFWWRDDDATSPGAKLDRLLELAPGVPRSLAVIPHQVEPKLGHTLRDFEWISVLQHGFAHKNHAPATEKKAEFGPHRSVSEMLEELEVGQNRLRKLFADTFRPIFVPPWNRIDPEFVKHLPGAGYSALSGFGRTIPGSAIPQINSHIDIIDWRSNRAFIGERAAILAIIRHLKLQRRNLSHAFLPTGLLTHHRDHDELCWKFIHELIDHTRMHSASNWISVDDAIASENVGLSIPD